MLARMKFIVENSTKIGGRLGHVELPRPSSGEIIVYPTPMFFIHTLAGSIPHITYEVFDLILGNVHSDDGGDQPLPPVQMSIDTTFVFHEAVGPSSMNISKFVGLPDSPSLLTVIDPTADNFDSGYNTKHGISIWTRVGRQNLNSKKFAQIISDFQPTLFQCVSDYDVTTVTSEKRMKKSTGRCIEYLSDTLLNVKFKSSGHISGLLATVEPAWFQINEFEGTKALTSMLENRDKIAGFFVKKNHNEQESFVKMTELFVDKLPAEKFRFVSGSFDLHEIIDLVLQGFDMFDSSICTKLTNEGKALVLPTLFFQNSNETLNESLPLRNSTSLDNESEIKEGCSSHATQLEVLDLNDKRNFDDFRPLSLDCSCYTCRKHTRSYIHHLLATKELLGQVLLMAHNLFTFDRFFKVLRISLRSPQETVDFDKLRKSVSPTTTTTEVRQEKTTKTT